MAFQYFPVKYVGLPTSMIQATATRQQWQLAKLLASLTCGGFSASPRENTRGTPRKRIWKLSILTLLVMFGFHVQSRGQKKTKHPLWQWVKLSQTWVPQIMRWVHTRNRPALYKTHSYQIWLVGSYIVHVGSFWPVPGSNHTPVPLQRLGCRQ